MKRISALLGKEFLDLRLHPWVLLPALLFGVGALIIPIIIVVIVPFATGELLSDDPELTKAISGFIRDSGNPNLNPEIAVQALMFQQFLMFLIVGPVLSATSTASHSVISEKQARTLEPLLATPITTFELLFAKVLAAFIPAILMTVACFVVDVTVIAILGKPGVLPALLTPRSLLTVLLLGPLAVFAALQIAVCVSSRVEDEKSAQTVGALVTLPIVGLMVAPLMGVQLMTVKVIWGLVIALVAANAGLMRLAIAVFDRESILTRWK
jgi:ABC-2 type transport system permease protein